MSDNVTSIGNGAFRNCSNLTCITLPNGVTSIGYEAFYGCTGLTSVTIPNGVTSIGEYAFNGCTGLTSVTIPEGVTSIDWSVFRGCTALANITIPDSVTGIGSYTFSDTAFYNDEDNWENGVLYIGNHLIKSSEELSGEYGIKPGTKVVAGGAFDGCTGLTSVTIPDSVTSIGYSAFSDCSGLTSITIPDGVTEISNGTFSGCTGLTSITIPDSVTDIGYGAFYDTAFYNDANNWENGVLYIGNYLIKTSYELPNEYTVKSGTKVIADEAFEYRTGLASITIPDSVTKIGYKAFYGCTGLTSITIPDSVTSIGDYTFYGCTGLTSMTIPDSVTKIGNKAFYGCTGLTSMTIPDSVTNISEDAFHMIANIGYFGNASGSPWGARAVNGYVEGSLVYEDSTKTRLLACSSSKQGVVIITDNVTSIGDCAFYGCTGLTNITIPDGITNIGSGTFYGCTGLKSVTIPDGVTSIGSEAFCNCTGLTSVKIPDGVTSIGDYAFYGCTELASISIPVSVTDVGWGAFGFTEKLSNKETVIGDFVDKALSVTVAYYFDYDPETEPSVENAEEFTEKSSSRNGEDAVTEISIENNLYPESTTVIIMPSNEPVAETGTEEPATVPIEDPTTDLSEVIVTGSTAKFTVEPSIESTASSSERVIGELAGTKTVAVDGANVFVATGDVKIAAVRNAAPGAKIVDKDGKEVSDTAPLATGMKIILNGESVEIAVLGDIDGNGEISVTDARLALRQAVSLENLKGVYLLAAQVGNDTVSVSEARKILRAAVGLDDSKDWLK